VTNENIIKNIKTRWVKSTDFLVGLALFFAAFVFFYDVLGGELLLTERDLGPYFIPPRFFWVDSIRQGNFPLWNPYQFSGHPFFANPQHGILYPLNVLFFLFPFDTAFNAIIILHFFLGGLFTYFFLKDLKANSAGALVSGLIFMLGGYLLSLHSLLTILLSVVWTPLIMMFFRRALDIPGLKNEIFVAIFMSISFLGGGIEIVYGNFFVLLFMVIFYSTSYMTSVEDKPRRGKLISSLPIYWGRIKFLSERLRSLLVVFILFLFLSAVQLFPFLELLYHSIRGSGISYQEATIWSFAPRDILLFFLPDAFGYFLDMKKYWVTQCWLKTLYTGGFPFILSLIFFLTPRSPLSPSGENNTLKRFDNNRKFYFSLMLFSLFLSLGSFNPLYPFVFKYVPFFNGIRYPVKFLYIFIIVLSITAGLGFKRLSEFSKGNELPFLKKLLLVFSLASGLLLIFLVLGHPGIEHFLKGKGIDAPAFNHLSINLYHAKRFLFYLALFFLLMRVGYEIRWKRWVEILLIFFLTADLFGNMGFYGKEKTSEYFQKTRIMQKITSDKGNFRTFSTSKTISLDHPLLIAETSPLDVFKEKHLPTMNLLYRLPNIWGIDVVRLKRIDELYHAFTGAASISATNLVELYGVKYIISVTPIEEDPRFELVYVRLEGLQGKKEDLLKANTVKLYRNRNPLPRAWLVKDYKVMDAGAILPAMVSKEFNPQKEVLLEEMPEQAAKKGAVNNKYRKGAGEPPREILGSVKIISERNNKINFLVKTTENAILVLNESFFPGWKVLVNGTEEKIYRANYTFQAVPLKAGSQRVEFVYAPLTFKIGAGITLLGIIGCILVGWMGRRR